MITTPELSDTLVISVINLFGEQGNVHCAHCKADGERFYCTKVSSDKLESVYFIWIYQNTNRVAETS